MPSFTFPVGTPVKMLDTNTGAGAVKSPGYAVRPPKTGQLGRAIAWKASYGGGPSAVSVAMQGAHRDVDAEYVNLDTSTNTAGEAKTILNVSYPWIRATQVSRTGGTDTTIEVTCQ